MKILYVDEIRTIGDLLRVRLAPGRRIARDGSRYEIDVATDYEQVLQTIREPDLYDVLVIETSPGGVASDVARSIIRAVGGTRTVTIVLTALPTLPDCIESMRAGAWDYIGKLQSMDYITQRLIESIERAFEERPINRADPDALYVERHFDQLAQSHANQWIAVGGGRFLDAADSYEKLAQLVAQIPVAAPKFWRMPPRRENA